MRKLALLIAAPLLLAACAQSANTPSAGGKADYAGSAPAPAADAASGYSGVASTTANQGIPTVVVTADRNLILTAKIDMRSKRSEERRVGKECKSRCAGYHGKKK